MKILRKPKRKKCLVGTCQFCGVKVGVDEPETKLMVDRDSPNGARYIHCPACSNEYLWVS